MDRLEDAADQPHVVVRGEPDHPLAVAAGQVAERLRDQVGVGQQVLLAEHHAARGAGRSGGVLEEGERVERLLAQHLVLGLRHLVDREPVRFGQRPALEQRLRGVADEGRGQHRLDFGVGGDRGQAGQGPVQALGLRRRRRDPDDARLEAGEDGTDVVEAGREEQQRVAAAGLVAEQSRRDRLRLAVKLGVGHLLVDLAVVGEEGEDGDVRFARPAFGQRGTEAAAAEVCCQGWPGGLHTSMSTNQIRSSATPSWTGSRRARPQLEQAAPRRMRRC